MTDNISKVLGQGTYGCVHTPPLLCKDSTEKDLNNVSKRFYQAAKFYELDHIVRITGDDILRDEVMIDKIVESHLYNSCDVSMTENMPYGTHSDVFSFEVIKLNPLIAVVL